MSKWFILTASIVLAVMVSLPISAATLASKGSFTGDFTETWESFDNYLDNPYIYMDDPTTIMSGAATISNPLMSIYQPNAGATFGLGDYPPAAVSDGFKAMGLDYSTQTATITAVNKWSAFGAYWGAAFVSNALDPTVNVTAYDEFDQIIGTDSFYYAGGSSLEWHGWTSSVAISKITYSGDYVVIDGLQANESAASAVPEPATLLGFGLPMLMVGIGKLRNLRK